MLENKRSKEELLERDVYLQFQELRVLRERVKVLEQQLTDSKQRNRTLTKQLYRQINGV